MTVKLYDEDWKLQSCQARVLRCESGGGGLFRVLLDKTVIFPEGGGQLADRGWIAGVPVQGAVEEGGLVWHLAVGPLEPGAEAEVRLDTAVREDHSCQHTGEHIVSGLAKQLFGAANVGFHMAEGYSTLDLELPLTAQQLEELELEANRAVRKNIPVTVSVTDAEGAKAMQLRKLAGGLEGPVRVVWIEGVDSCTCCGTHCSFTGEVGAIKFTATMKYKGGVRVWFSCGERAVRHAACQQGTLDALARRFSAKAEDVEACVVRQGNELAQARRELKQRTAELLGFRAAELSAAAEELGGMRVAVYCAEGLGLGELKLLAEKLCAEPGMVAVLFSLSGQSVLYQLARGQAAAYSMKELCTVVNSLFSGKGGGREESAQGSAKAASFTPEALEQLRAYLRRALA